jgi:hypothetical protein
MIFSGELEKSEVLMSAEEKLRDALRIVPEWIKVCENDSAPLVIIHQDAFAVNHQDEELYLLGAAIKFAGLRKKEVHIIP